MELPFVYTTYGLRVTEYEARYPEMGVEGLSINWLA